jgi:hypothetical protein
MNSPIQIAETFARLMKLLHALHEISPNPYLHRFHAAKTASELYDAALSLAYAANSKELRDTSDERVHVLSNAILLQIAELNASFRTKLTPNSPQQKQSWEKTVSLDPTGKYAFRSDGSVEISLMDSEILESILHVKRVWSHVSNFGGSWTDFRIRLDEGQVRDLKRKLAELRTFTHSKRALASALLLQPELPQCPHSP